MEMQEVGKYATRMYGAVLGQDRKSLICFGLSESSESEPSLQVKLEEGPPLAGCSSG